MYSLGISAFYHDSAAALVRDGEILSAVQEERFTRDKHDQSLPVNAVRYCLDQAGIGIDQLDCVAFYEKPILTFNRLLETYLAFAPRGLPSFVVAMPQWVKEKAFQKSLIEKGLNGLGLGAVPESKIVFGFHHQSHAASAFYPSPFDEAAVLVVDGVGEWATTSLARGNGTSLEMLGEIRFPHSIGMLYSAFTYYLGFKVNDGEYKMMGLAPYGEPKFASLILDKLIDLKDDGSFRLNMEYFNYCTGLTMTNGRFDELFGAPPRPPESLLTQRDMDLASSVQFVTEEMMLRLARTAQRRTGSKNLCMAGGVALNCVANGRILREGPFENVWIQPAAGDAGAAIGVAMDACYRLNGSATRAPRGRDAMKGAYLGPSFDMDAVRAALTTRGAVFEEMPETALLDAIADALAQDKVVGWFQGRMEFGPRALGNRSILGDARSATMQRMLNMKVKYRESFRPFAPIVLREDVSEFFELDRDSPYMMLVASVKQDRRTPLSEDETKAFGLDRLNQLRSDIPAVTHVDYSARIQTVDGKENPRLHKLLEAFKARTGYGVLVNTSFNVRDEPIVCTPDDAYRCFMSTEMDVLVVENAVLFKDKQQRSMTVGGAVPSFSGRILSCLKEPGEDDDAGLTLEAGGLRGVKTGRFYPFVDGKVPSLFVGQSGTGEQVTSAVKSFYEENPFPSYEGLEEFGQLVHKGSQNPFSASLLEAIGYNKTVLECGCGTGQLSHYLQLNNNHVLGIDMSIASLKLAIEHKQHNELARSSFAQMNIFDLAIKDGSFDVVISHGVLHHTFDARRAFAQVARKVKPGGIIMVGLYNYYARVPTYLRSKVVGLTGGKIDYVVRTRIQDARKADIWIKDQYYNPHETWHSIDEVMKWFDENDIEYINTSPPILGTDSETVPGLFSKSDPGTAYQRIVTQLGWLGTIAREGALFDVIGRRKMS